MCKRLGLPLLLLAGCATTGAPSQSAVDPSAPVERYEMEPIKIEAVKGPAGVRLEAFDATELFEQGGDALSKEHYDEALRAYDRLLESFRDSRFVRAALYNAGLAHIGRKDWAGAVARFKALAEQHPDSGEAKDGLFQLGASYAELGNWPTSATTFARVLERTDLTADDRIEAMGRRGFAQFRVKDLDTAERTFKSALIYYRQVESEERLQTDFYLGLCQYHLGQIPHERFRAIPLRLPEQQMEKDMDDKAKLLLFAQRQYIDAIKLGNPQWASASGFQIASLYEELYDAFIHAPVPLELRAEATKEAREIYYEELRKKIRILLEKSLRVHEKNLLMMERLGVRNEWREKSQIAYAKLQKLLDPANKFDFADPAVPAAAPTSPGPPVPPAPARPTAPLERKRDRREESPERQIL